MNESPSNLREKTKAELENIKRKSGLMQCCQGILAEKNRVWEDRVAITVSLLAGLASFLLTVDPAKIGWTGVTQRGLFCLASIASGIVFILSIVRRQMEWASQSGRHSAALERYTQLLRSVHFFLGSRIDTLADDKVVEEAKRLVDEYAVIGESVPKVPSDMFLALKQKHLQTIAISKALDTSPFTKLKTLKKRLVEKES